MKLYFLRVGFVAALMALEFGCVSNTPTRQRQKSQEVTDLTEKTNFAVNNHREVLSARMISDFALKKGDSRDVIARLDRVFKPDGSSFDVSDCVVTGTAMYPGLKQKVIVNLAKISCNSSQPKVPPTYTLFAVDHRGTLGLDGTFDVASSIQAIASANLPPQVAAIQQQDLLNTEVLSMKETFMIVSDGADIFPK
jgi:hypothetical protein